MFLSGRAYTGITQGMLGVSMLLGPSDRSEMVIQNARIVSRNLGPLSNPSRAEVLLKVANEWVLRQAPTVVAKEIGAGLGLLVQAKKISMTDADAIVKQVCSKVNFDHLLKERRAEIAYNFGETALDALHHQVKGWS